MLSPAAAASLAHELRTPVNRRTRLAHTEALIKGDLCHTITGSIGSWRAGKLEALLLLPSERHW